MITVGTATGWLSIQTVPTGSMEPAIGKGSVTLVDPIPVDEVAVGDIIVFAAPETDRMTVHRVVEPQTENDRRVFITKGDANEAPDPWRLLPDEDHLHRVRFDVPGVGQVLLALSSPWARMALAGVGGALVLWFGLTHVWRREPAEGHSEQPASGRDVARRPRQAHRAAPPPRDTTPIDAEGEAETIDQAVDAAQARRLESFDDLLLAADPAPDGTRPSESEPTGGPSRSIGKSTVVVLVAVAIAGAAILVPTRVANAGFNATSTAAGAVETLTVPPKTSVTCSWDTATSTTIAWANPNATDSTQMLVATTSGGSTTVGATAAAGTTSVAYSPAAPLTTPKFLSTRAVDGTWTSVTSPEMPTNECRKAVNLFAGAGAASFTGDGGAATAATLNAPMQTAEAADGRVFIADSANNRIRVVSTAGAISTFAGGAGAASVCTYTGTVAGLRMSAPHGVAVDSAGNVYIADTGANCVRKVDTAGNVTRVAGGGGTTACTATTATAVSLSAPSDVEVDASGGVYIADTNRNCVRKVTGTTVTVVAGGGGTTACTATTATAVSLSGPLGIDLDSSGNVYIADTNRNCVRKVTGTTVTVVAGGGATTACNATATTTTIRLSTPRTSRSTRAEPCTSPTQGVAACARSRARPSPRSPSPAPTAPPATAARPSA